jgi:chemotaxis protein methyltransferase CheR
MTDRATLEARLMRELGLSMDRGGTRRSIDRFLEALRAELGLGDVDDVLRRVLTGDGDEFERLIETVTIPHSWFYRDPEQWQTIEAWMRAHDRRRPLDVWVPACATGEDVYTVALLAARTGTPTRVLGTDIHGPALRAARCARYGAWALRELPRDLREGLREIAEGSWEVRPEVRTSVEWGHHNLMHLPPPSPSGAGWDLVLCRNVLFYFPQATALEVVQRLANALSERGRVVLGASDMLHSAPRGCQSRIIGRRTVIERVAPGRESSRPKAPARVVPAPVAAPATRRISKPPRPARTPDSTRPPMHESLDPVARLMRGVARLSDGDAAAAVADLRAALFLSPVLWPAEVYLGLAHERAGHAEEATRCFDRAVSGGMPTTHLDALPAELLAYCDELAALARRRSRRKLA